MKKILSIMVLILSLSLLSSIAFADDSEEDKEQPNDVEETSATVNGSSIVVSWDAVTDNVGVTGYKIGYGTETVTDTKSSFDNEVDVGNVTTYTFSSLDADTTYFFGIYAYDAAGNESPNWSDIASATTPSDETNSSEDDSGSELEADTEAPTLANVESLNKEEVKVVFSEKVVLPAEDAVEIFTIENQSNFTFLDVNEAVMDEDDEDGKTVILTTANQEANVEYKITIGINLKDEAGNSIVSGTADTGSFTGTDSEKEEADSVGPSIVKIETINSNNLIVSFDETIVLDVNPLDNFIITADDDETNVLEIKAVQLVPGIQGLHHGSAIIETDVQDSITYLFKLVDLTDEEGNVYSSEGSTMTFEGVKGADTADDSSSASTADDSSSASTADDSSSASTADDSSSADTTEMTIDEVEDTEPPLDVTNFKAQQVFESQKYVVKLSWNNPSANTGDTAKQILYMSVNDEDAYDMKADIDAGESSFDYGDLEPGEYYFKLTQEDEAGNESEGSVVRVVLSETGPGLVGLVLASVGLGRVVGRKKRQ